MIKVLIVEDNQDKIRRVLEIVKTALKANVEDILVARDAHGAKKLLLSDEFDLMILDIALPEHSDQLPEPDGGIELLEEILERDYFKKPREIVGLTAYSEVREKASQRFADDLWQVLQYEPNSDDWAKQLTKKLKYIQLCKQQHPTSSYGSDLAVLTALQYPEFEAVKRLPWNWAPMETEADPTIYLQGSFESRKGRKQVIAASAPRMGMAAAAVAAMKLITQFRPKLLCMVGITAGIKGSCELGDVLIAEHVWDYGSGKKASKDGKSVFQPAPYQLHVDSFLLGRLSHMSQDQELLDSVKREWKGKAPATSLSMHIGPMASGSAVLADAALIEDIKHQHRKLIGVEMEAYGVLVAAAECQVPQPKAFILKSVCDFADHQKNDDVQDYAAYTSATIMKAFVEKYL